MQQSGISVFSLLLLLFIMTVSCDTEDPFSFEPPDFSTVPDPYDTVNVEPVDLYDGVKAYIHEDGHGSFQVTARDQVDAHLTLRTESGEVIYSTFSSGRTDPLPVSMSIADGKDPAVHQTINQQIYTVLIAYTPGFKDALLGMRNGEKRTLVISPEQGYKNIPTNRVNTQYKDSTLIYNIQISHISPTKSR